jgi:hypothetical protein
MRLIRRSDQVLRQYVLGELQEPPRLEIEERLVTDPDFFESLGVTEEELIEEYLEGTLSAADAERFERHYLTNAARRRDVAFVRLLKSYAAGRRTPGAVTDRPRILDLIRFYPVWASAAAAIVVLLIGGNLWLIAGNYRLQGQFDQVRVQQKNEEQLRQQLQQQIAGLTSQANTLQTRFEFQGAGVPPPTFGLTPGRLRSAVSQVQLVTFPAGAQHVRLQLQLPGDDSSPYRAVLLDESGDNELWFQSRLTAETISGQATVVVLVPTQVLSPGGHQLRLSAAAARGSLATYWFSVN